MFDAMDAFGSGDGTVAKIVGRIAVPVCEAVLAHRRRDHQRAVALMRPIFDDMHQLGGSHAQQDVMMQMFLEADEKADWVGVVRLIMRGVYRTWCYGTCDR